MSAPIIQVKRGLLANLPALKAGEPGFTTDSYDLYVGKDNNAANNQFVGSGRYWTVNTATTASGVNLVEGTDNGTSHLILKAPDSLPGIQTYTFPATPTDTFFLKTDANGVLSWSNQFPEVGFSGIVTFTDTTDNTLGNPDTGAVQIDGGLGVNKNVSIGSNFYVEGHSEFVGLTTITNTTENTLGTTDSGALQVDGGMGVDGNVTVGGGLSVTGTSYFVGEVTFAAGSNGNITIGDANTDNLVINADVNSHIIPNTDDTYDLGSSSQEWRDLYIDGTAYIDSLSADEINLSGVTTVSTLTENRIPIVGAGSTLEDDANLTFDGSTLTVGVDLDVDGQTDLDHVAIVGVATITGAAIIDNVRIGHSGTGEIDTSSGDLTLDSASGNTVVDDNLTVSGNLIVQGSTTQVDTNSLTVEDRTIELGVVDGAAPSSATTWDLGILFNYNSSGAKKAAVAWDHGDTRFKFAAVATDTASGNNNTSPEISYTTMASIEILSLFVQDGAGTHEVIKYDTGSSQRVLLDITVDGGSF